MKLKFKIRNELNKLQLFISFEFNFYFIRK